MTKDHRVGLVAGLLRGVRDQGHGSVPAFDALRLFRLRQGSPHLVPVVQLAQGSSPDIRVSGAS